jgi:hypothetical protein
MGIRPNHLQRLPILYLFSSCYLLRLFVASDLRRAVTKVKYTLFLFSPFSEQRPI